MHSASFVIYNCHLSSISGSVESGTLDIQTSTTHDIQTDLYHVFNSRNLKLTIHHVSSISLCIGVKLRFFVVSLEMEIVFLQFSE